MTGKFNIRFRPLAFLWAFGLTVAAFVFDWRAGICTLLVQFNIEFHD